MLSLVFVVGISCILGLFVSQQEIEDEFLLAIPDRGRDEALYCKTAVEDLGSERPGEHFLIAFDEILAKVVESPLIEKLHELFRNDVVGREAFDDAFDCQFVHGSLCDLLVVEVS